MIKHSSGLPPQTQTFLRMSLGYFFSLYVGNKHPLTPDNNVFFPSDLAWERERERERERMCSVTLARVTNVFFPSDLAYLYWYN